MDLPRIFRHLAMTNGKVKQAFAQPTLQAIEQAIKASETSHMGEIRFVVEGALDGPELFALHSKSARERAIDLFAHLRIWDTEHNTGVLIYVLLADRQVEIVADRGIHAKVGDRAWTSICHAMQTAFKEGQYQDGAVSGILAVTHQLVEHFPADTDNQNELPDSPLML